MKRWFVLLGLASVAACGGSRQDPASQAPPASASTAISGAVQIEGNYEYIANIPGQTVRGMLRVLGDTIIVVPHADYCQPVTGTPDPIVIRYTCNGPGRFERLILTLDRRNPAQFSKWAATVRVQKTREVCVRYEIRGGQQVCAMTSMERYEQDESRSGNLQVRRAQ